MNEEIIVTLDTKERLYDYCENVEELYDKFYLPLIKYSKWLEQENQQLKEENIKLGIKLEDKAYEELKVGYQTLKEENKKYKQVIDKLNDAINKMIHTGYLVENDNGAIQFMATSEKSEFGTRAIVLLDILKEVK